MRVSFKSVVKVLNCSKHEYEEATLEKLKVFGFTGVKSGSYKTVYLHPDGFVVKHAKGKRVIDDEYEVRRFASRKGMMQWLPKQRRLSDTVIKQERADPSMDKFDKHKRKILKAAETLGIFEDTRSVNVGFRKDGSPVFIDYQKSLW